MSQIAQENRISRAPLNPVQNYTKRVGDSNEELKSPDSPYTKFVSENNICYDDRITPTQTRWIYVSAGAFNY